MPPRYRPDLDRIHPYRPGRPIAEVAAEFGLTDVIKLASNESPDPPFPEVQEAIAAHLAGVNRYPDNAKPLLVDALSDHLAVPRERIWCGGASNELMLITALSMGGPTTSAVYAWPSFGLYQIGSRAAFADDIAIPVDDSHRHDLDAMGAAIRDDTTVVYVCNPNNPTSTHVGGGDLEAFVRSVPPHALVVIDEAYAEFATADDYRSMLPLAVELDNVMVTRTFSKVYGLAGLRVGYGVTHPESIERFRRIQLPFTVNTLGEIAAAEALKHQDRVKQRIAENAERVAYLTSALRDRHLEVADSQTNFVYANFGDRAKAITDALLEQGIIVRPVIPDGWLRITAGTPDQNQRFVDALDGVS